MARVFACGHELHRIVTPLTICNKSRYLQCRPQQLTNTYRLRGVKQPQAPTIGFEISMPRKNSSGTPPGQKELAVT
jgi:hypothetical protein